MYRKTIKSYARSSAATKVNTVTLLIQLINVFHEHGFLLIESRTSFVL